MKNNMTPDEKFQMMTQTPVEKLIVTLAIPTITSMLITSIYNMADTFFVSKISTSASGAVGVAFSLMSIIQAVGFTIGMGSGNYISRLLGQKKREHAAQVAATGFFTALILGVVITVIGLIFLGHTCLRSRSYSNHRSLCKSLYKVHPAWCTFHDRIFCIKQYLTLPRQCILCDEGNNNGRYY